MNDGSVAPVPSAAKVVELGLIRGIEEDSADGELVEPSHGGKQCVHIIGGEPPATNCPD